MGAGGRAIAAQPVAAPLPRVLLDARKLLDGGIGVYIQNLVSGLVGAGVRTCLLGEPSSVVRFPWANQVRVLPESARGYSLRELFFMTRNIPWHEFDLFHEPHYTLPFGIPVRRVVTIHDLIHITHPERFYYPWVATAAVRSALARADGVIAVSRATAELLRRNFTRTDVAVIPNAVSPELLAAAGSAGALPEGPYLFALLSQPKPHKGGADLLRAWELLPDHRGTSLVVAGRGASGVAGRDVLALGELSTAELHGLYAHARAVVVPSRAEGFSLPVLEAHALGVPVLLRPVPAMLELALPADTVCSDLSLEALVKGLSQLLARSPAPIDAPAVRQRYSVASVTAQTLALYQAVLGGA